MGQSIAERADRPPAEDHRRELERSRKRWEFWSSHWSFYEQDSVEMRRATVDALDLQSGDAVLDLGCGTGVNFEMLRAAVGPEGLVVGVDLTDGMVARARERIDREGWDNVAVIQGDATRMRFRRPFDAAIATTALSAMPDVAGALDGVLSALRPGAPVAVHEIRRIPAGPARVLNPLVVRFYDLFGRWNDDEDVLTELRERFEDVRILETHALGTNYVAVGTAPRE